MGWGALSVSLFGRKREVDAIDALVGRVRESGGGLVIWGEPGIGKSGLLEHAVGRAGELGLVVLRGAGVQSEAKLPFAGLHQLARPMLGRAGELPSRQRAALSAAFGMGEETTPEPFMIALAALNLLSDAAAVAPLLLLYLSHRTVGAHLYRLFPKLGITSRTQLRDALY